MTKEEHAKLIADAETWSLPVLIWITLIGECVGEKRDGKIMVAHVCLQRETDKLLWNDILANRQFSCWNYGSNRLDEMLHPDPLGNTAHRECLDIAYGVAHRQIPRPLARPATHYFATKAMQALYGVPRPPWANKMEMVGEIGGHTFLLET